MIYLWYTKQLVPRITHLSPSHRYDANLGLWYQGCDAMRKGTPKVVPASTADVTDPLHIPNQCTTAESNANVTNIALLTITQPIPIPRNHPCSYPMHKRIRDRWSHPSQPIEILHPIPTFTYLFHHSLPMTTYIGSLRDTHMYLR